MITYGKHSPKITSISNSFVAKRYHNHYTQPSLGFGLPKIFSLVTAVVNSSNPFPFFEGCSGGYDLSLNSGQTGPGKVEDDLFVEIDFREWQVSVIHLSPYKVVKIPIEKTIPREGWRFYVTLYYPGDRCEVNICYNYFLFTSHLFSTRSLSSVRTNSD